jgi:hypothetical protein
MSPKKFQDPLAVRGYSVPEREIATLITERQFRQYNVYYNRFSRWVEPNHTELTYHFNGHVVTLVEGMCFAEHPSEIVLTEGLGPIYSVCFVDGDPIVIELHTDDQSETGCYPASEMFQYVTGWFPFEFRNICSEIEKRCGVKTTFDRVDIAVSRGAGDPWGSLEGDRARMNAASMGREYRS